MYAHTHILSIVHTHKRTLERSWKRELKYNLILMQKNVGIHV